MTVEYPRAVEIARRVKSDRADVLAAVGGAHVNAVGRPGARGRRGVRLRVRRRGRGGRVRAAEALEQGSDPSQIAGLVSRRNGEIVNGTHRPPPPDYDALPFPAWDLFEPVRTLPLLTHRGCPFKCVFCGHNSGFKPRYRTPENVLQEVEEVLNRFRPERIRVEDETFGLHMGSHQGDPSGDHRAWPSTGASASRRRPVSTAWTRSSSPSSRRRTSRRWSWASNRATRTCSRRSRRASRSSRSSAPWGSPRGTAQRLDEVHPRPPERDARDDPRHDRLHREDQPPHALRVDHDPVPRDADSRDGDARRSGTACCRAAGRTSTSTRAGCSSWRTSASGAQALSDQGLRQPLSVQPSLRGAGHARDLAPRGRLGASAFGGRTNRARDARPVQVLPASRANASLSRSSKAATPCSRATVLAPGLTHGRGAPDRRGVPPPCSRALGGKAVEDDASARAADEMLGAAGRRHDDRHTVRQRLGGGDAEPLLQRREGRTGSGAEMRRDLGHLAEHLGGRPAASPAGGRRAAGAPLGKPAPQQREGVHEQTDVLPRVARPSLRRRRPASPAGRTTFLVGLRCEGARVDGDRQQPDLAPRPRGGRARGRRARLHRPARPA